MSERKLPERIYVRWDGDDPESSFLLAAEDKSEIAKQEDTVVGGIYQLMETVTIINETRIG